MMLSYNTSDRDELERKSAKLKLRLGCFETSTTCSLTGNENPLVIVKPTDKKFDTSQDVCHQAPAESPLRNLRKRILRMLLNIREAPGKGTDNKLLYLTALQCILGYEYPCFNWPSG